jgi:hypothetical protein
MGGAVTAFDNVRNRFAVERDGNQATHAFLASFFNRRRNFIGFAIAPANFAFAIANDDHRGEAEAATTLHNGGAALDFNDRFREFAFDAFAAVTTLATAAPTAPASVTAAALAATAPTAGTTATALATVTTTALASIASFAGTSRHMCSLSKN